MSTRLHLDIGPGEIRAEARRGARVLWNARAPLATMEDLPDVLRVLRPDVGTPVIPRRVLVSMSDGLIQRRTLLDLPPVERPALRALIARGAGRYFRQNGHPLVTDARWDAASPNGARRALAVALDGALAGAVVHAIREAGATLEDIVPAEDAGLSLLPPAEHARQQRAAWRVTSRFLAVALVVWLCAGIVVAAAHIREDLRLGRELAELERPRAALTGAHRAMDEASGMITELAVAEAARRVLGARLTRLLDGVPDSAFLGGLTLSRDGVGQLHGWASSAQDVVRALGADDPAAVPRLQGGVSQEELEGRAWQRFTIGLGRAP